MALKRIKVSKFHFRCKIQCLRLSGSTDFNETGLVHLPVLVVNDSDLGTLPRYSSIKWISLAPLFLLNTKNDEIVFF